MVHLVQEVTQQACVLVEYFTETVLLSAPKEKPVLQCRAKRCIPVGRLRLCPHGGIVSGELSDEAISQRTKDMRHCYMRSLAVHVTATSRYASNRFQVTVQLLSPMSAKGWAMSQPAEDSGLRHVDPFWAGYVVGSQHERSGQHGSILGRVETKQTHCGFVGARQVWSVSHREVPVLDE